MVPLAEAITLITPFYNTGLIFHETANSVLQQSLREWRWLIINDGSTTPESLDTLSQYREADSRIEVVDCPTNTGISAARNLSFRLAQTGIVAQLDSDDLLEPTALEKWLWFLESCPEYSFVKGYSTGFGARQYAWDKGFHYGPAFLRDNLVDPPAAIRKCAWEAAGGYDESNRSGLEDWDFWLRCANTGHWGSTIPEYLNRYRTRANHRDRWQNLGARELSAFRHRLRQRYPQLWRGDFPKIHLSPLAGPGSNFSPDDPESLLRNDMCECGFSNRLPGGSKRLLLIIPWMEMGGADKFNLDLVQQLTHRGWEVTIAATAAADNVWIAEFARLTPDIFCLPNFLRLADYPRFLRYLIGSRQPSAVLVSHSEMGYRLLPYLRSHFPDLPLLDYCHVVEEGWRDGGYPQLSLQYQNWLDATGATSQSLKTWMVQAGAAPQRIEVCYLGVDSDQWKPDATVRSRLRQEMGLDEKTLVILYAARFCLQKQPLVFAKTMRLLKQSRIPFAALAAGGGPLEADLRAYLKRKNLLDHVQILGPLPIKRLREVMAASDIFFLPSAWEGIALTLYEALAAGLAVVGADVGGQRELVTPDCGILLPRNEPDQEAQAYSRVLIDLLQNPERRKYMALSGQKRAAEFSLEAMGDRMVDLLQKAHEHRARQPGSSANPADREQSLIDAINHARADGAPQVPLLIQRQQTQNNRGWNLYVFLQRWGMPFYRVAFALSGGRVRVLKSRIKKRLTGVL